MNHQKKKHIRIIQQLLGSGSIAMDFDVSKKKIPYSIYWFLFLNALNLNIQLIDQFECSIQLHIYKY